MGSYRSIWRWMSFIVALSPLGCAATLAETGSEQAAGPAEPSKGTKPSRTSSALAYEHYLKSRLTLEKGLVQDAILELQKALIYDHESALLHTRLGQLVAATGNWMQAEEEAEKALAINPNYLDALLLRGQGFRRSGNNQQAIQIYQRAITLDRSNIEAYIQLAEVLLNQGEKEPALHILKEMTDANPESAKGFRRLADLYFERGEEKQAEVYYRRVLEIDPSDTFTTKTLTSLLEQQGRYREAIEVFVDALESSPENPFYMAYMARLYLKDGDEKLANAYFDQLRASNPENASIIARVYSDLNLHRLAIRELEGLLKDNPNLDSERLLLALLFEQRKQWQQALAHLELIPPTSKFQVNAQTSIGYCLMQLKRLEEATAVLKAALDLTQDRDELGRIYRTLSGVYAKRKLFQEGLRVMDDAIRRYPDLNLLVEAKADLLFEAGMGGQAEEVLKKELAKNAREVSFLYALGALYERMGRVPESLKVMQQVVEIEPNNYTALNFIGYTLADRGENLDEAERLIRRALMLDPGNGAITDSLGWVLFRKGNYQQALEYLQRADNISPGEPVIIMHLGDACLNLHNRKEAVRQYRRALESDPEPRDRQEILKRLKQLGIRP